MADYSVQEFLDKETRARQQREEVDQENRALTKAKKRDPRAAAHRDETKKRAGIARHDEKKNHREAEKRARLPSAQDIYRATSLRVAAMIGGLPARVQAMFRKNPGKVQNIINDAAGLFNGFNQANPAMAISPDAIATGGDTVNAIVSREISDEQATVAQRAAWLQQKLAEKAASKSALKGAFIASVLGSHMAEATLGDEPRAGSERGSAASTGAGDTIPVERVSYGSENSGMRPMPGIDSGFGDNRNYGGYDNNYDRDYDTLRNARDDSPLRAYGKTRTLSSPDGMPLEKGSLAAARAELQDKKLNAEQKNAAASATLIDPARLLARATERASAAALTPDATQAAPAASIPSAGSAQANESLQASVRPSASMQALRRMLSSPVSTPAAATPAEAISAAKPEEKAEQAQTEERKDPETDAKTGRQSSAKYNRGMPRHQPGFMRKPDLVAQAPAGQNSTPLPKLASASIAPAADAHAAASTPARPAASASPKNLAARAAPAPSA